MIFLRILQGLALGGEYGGAAIYVSEHCPPEPARVLHRLHPGERGRRLRAQPDRWCWLCQAVMTRGVRGSGLARCRSCSRIVLLAISLWMRSSSREPGVQAMKEAGTHRRATRSTESFTYPGQQEAHLRRAVRRRRRPHGHLVHRDVPGARRSSTGRCGSRRPWPRSSSASAAVRDGLLRAVREDLGHGRTQAADRAGLHASRLVLLFPCFWFMGWALDPALDAAGGPGEKIVPGAGAIAVIIVLAADAGRAVGNDVRLGRGTASPKCSRRASATRRCRSPTTSAPATSAVSCR